MYYVVLATLRTEYKYGFSNEAVVDSRNRRLKTRLLTEFTIF